MCETKIKNIFQEKLEIHDNIIIERTHRTKGKTTRNNTARKKITEVKQLRSEGKIAYLNYLTVVTKRRDNEG